MGWRFETEADYYVWARQITAATAPLETKALDPGPPTRPPATPKPAAGRTWQQVLTAYDTTVKAQLRQRDVKITALDARLRALEGRKL